MEPSLLVVLWILIIGIQLPGNWNHLPPLHFFFFAMLGAMMAIYLFIFFAAPPHPETLQMTVGPGMLLFSATLQSVGTQSLTYVVTVQLWPGFDSFVFICIPQGGREYKPDTRVSLGRSRSFERGWLAGHLGVIPFPSLVCFHLAPVGLRRPASSSLLS